MQKNTNVLHIVTNNLPSMRAGLNSGQMSANYQLESVTGVQTLTIMPMKVMLQMPYVL